MAQVVVVCGRCKGSGTKVTPVAFGRAEKNPCYDCDGLGRLVLDEDHPFLKGKDSK